MRAARRSIAPKLFALLAGRSESQDPNAGEIAIALGIIESITHHKFIGDAEANVIGTNRSDATLGFIEQDRDPQALGLALLEHAQQVLQRHSGVEDIFDDNNGFSLDAAIQIASELHLPGGLRAIPIAGHADEVDRHGARDLAGKIGEKKDRTFQDAYQLQRLMGKILANLARELRDALLYTGARDEQADAFFMGTFRGWIGCVLRHVFWAARGETLAYGGGISKAGRAAALLYSTAGDAVLEAAKTTILFISALFPIVNPLGGSPIFLLLTRDYSEPERKLLSQRIAMNSFILLVASFVVGTHILTFFGISLPVVQVGGGLVVISTGWAMLEQKDEDEKSRTHREMNPRDISRHAFYPLTLPLTVGPGSISIAITLGANVPQHFRPNMLAIVAAVIGSAVIAVSIFLCYGFADQLARLLGPTGMSVILRLSSFLLVCIGVQILWNGASALLRSLPAAGH